MVPTFANPWALWALAAVPALVAIYLLRRQMRRHVVSSLLLWGEDKRAREGGLKRDRLRTPPPFFFELLALLLLLSAAAGPRLRAPGARQPLVVVLDDSFSMLAGGEASARELAARELEGLLEEGSFEPVRLVLAGEEPQLLEDPTAHGGGPRRGLARTLSQWTCGASTAALDEAVALGFDLAGDDGVVAVLTDQAPPESDRLASRRLSWWAFGRPLGNRAFVTAVRSGEGEADSLLLEVANLAAEAASVRLDLERFDLETFDPDAQDAEDVAAEGAGAEASRSLGREEIAFEPGEVRRLTFRLGAGVGPVAARLTALGAAPDELAVDDRVLLLPDERPPVRVDVRLAGPVIRSAVERALEATGRAVLDAESPQLVFTDAPGSGAASGTAAGTWTVRFEGGPGAAAFLGPFVLDRSHPLTDGLSLGGVLWAAERTEDLPGRPVVAAGNVPLLTVQSGPRGREEVLLRLEPRLSTLQSSAAWPALVWNLLDWRSASVPGLRPANLRLGTAAELRLPAEAGGPVRVVPPAGDAFSLEPSRGAVRVEARSAGLWKLEAAGEVHRFAANAVAAEESDLRAAARGRWGSWDAGGEAAWRWRSVAWLPLVGALGVLALHLLLYLAEGRRRALRL